jgi:hypothetical protein
MVTRGLRVVLVALLVVAGGSVISMDTVTPSANIESANMQSARNKAHCHGLRHRDVRGTKPTYTHRLLADFPNHKRMCHGIWLPRPRRYLVPQGLAITGNTAWVSGFRYRSGFGRRPCQLMRVGLTTGRRLDFHNSIHGRVGHRPRTFCRHGGGIMQRGRWLWIVEKSKLWLVDPTQRGTSLEARRAWRIESPVRGSAVVATAQRIGLVPFQKRGVARIYWFSFKRLMEPGVLDLAVRNKGRSQLGAAASTRVPRYVQGAAISDSGRLYLTRSSLACGELVTSSGKLVAFVPGAEGIQFSSGERRLLVVSESGSWPYSSLRKPLTPAVSSFEWPGLARGKATRCHFPAP